MIDSTFVELSRWQFASTALYHFLFVPLTLGLSWLLVIMETVYVMSGKEIYKDMTKFWGKLFGINFALGVTTGLTMEFEFGTNWSYYSHYVGDVFGAPLAIEGLMAFFLESTFIGLFFLGWDRLSKRKHLAVTFLTAIGSNLSALWILIANGWMQNPVGAVFSPETMRMEMTSFAEVFLNPVAQVKFVHTVAAGYVTASVFVMGISAWYILKGRDLAFARRSFAVAVGFGLAASLSVIVLGDESGYTLGDVQKVKLAAIEGEWKTEPAPAGFTVFGFPSQTGHKTGDELKIPAILGLIATRSLDTPVTGLADLETQHAARIRSGQIAYAELKKIRAGDASPQTRATFDAHVKDLGFGLLLKQFVEDPATATEAQIKAAAASTIPTVWPLFWAFRIMVAMGFLMLFAFAVGFWLNASKRLEHNRWFLRLAVLLIPAPWIASETGWFVAEFGRQPWAIGEVLPTFMATSSLTSGDLIFSLAGFLTFYTILLVIELFLMFKFARLGPSSLGTGRYHFERDGAAVVPAT
ncbi:MULTISPECIES: cytochrome ubiquinol oxidase subunit I [Rhodopseudomonas]|uniref:Cytochrome d terminal oxidase subunit 1 n=1 Tax=Rhodopseudomonas palustris TaxID=1076 RepID=A0A0D7F7F3_RHOPL|nr:MULTISPECIES: cytochrome ubiquinol oxidase subunit I [Rhodopseudomonas]KIZ47657.1 cytochrome d terminal oxidase subunit 1 [Rhodopseudomonas palustris]MDF3808859.1 cytochrome ubiquinol oxidase subunit I [Rhodopseudomonas sp. BAL398]WOK20658.1 cytochrome ubiquinol oxidase subunit I [Rhodopseudomonas sp. BAL398]